MSGFGLHEGHPVDVLPAYARGVASDRDAIERHLADCESCRLEVEILRALEMAGPAPLSDREREGAFEAFRQRRSSGTGGSSSRRSTAPWLATAWRVAAGVALLLTSVGVWQVVQGGPPVPDWDPDAAIDGWLEDLADLDLGVGDVRLALGVGLLDDAGPRSGWMDMEDGGGELVGEISPPWEEDR